MQYLFEDNLKVVINDEKYKIDYVRKAILVLENYINFHLDTNINAQKILWGLYYGKFYKNYRLYYRRLNRF